MPSSFWPMAAPKRRGGRSKPVQHERTEQLELARRVSTQWWAPFWIHVGNERVNAIEAAQMTAAGVKRGVPDNFLLLRTGDCPGAVSELKRPGAPPSSTSEEQRWWIESLGQQGYRVAVHYSALEAMAFFEAHAASLPTQARARYEARARVWREMENERLEKAAQRKAREGMGL